MPENSIPYRRTFFVCTNVRSDGRVACANPGRGGDRICKALKDEVKKSGLKGKIRVARSGCLDLCEKGPNLFLYPDNVWFSGAKEEEVPALWRRIQEGL